MVTENKPNELETFLRNKEEAKIYLSQYGESGKDKNIGVSLSYENIAKIDPLFVWFSAATLGSIQVGKVISLVDNPILNNCESTQTISLGFSYGNQEIHNNVTALFNTYHDHGIQGLKDLKLLDKMETYISLEAIAAFEKYSEIQSIAKSYADKTGLSLTDPKLIKFIMSEPGNIDALYNASKYLIQHEQKIVQDMYEKKYSSSSVGETLNDASYIEKLIANKIEFSGAKILDTYLSTEGYNMSSYEERTAIK